MPWNAPRSLTPDDTYALVAFILSIGEVVPDDFVLSIPILLKFKQKCLTAMA
jgi:cytochrome c